MSESPILLSSSALDYAQSKDIKIVHEHEVSALKANTLLDDVICFIINRDYSQFDLFYRNLESKKAFLYSPVILDASEAEIFCTNFADVFVEEVALLDMVKILHKHCRFDSGKLARRKNLQWGGYELNSSLQDIITSDGVRVKLTMREFDFLKFHFDRLVGNQILEETVTSIVEMDRKDALVYNLKKKVRGINFRPSQDKTYTLFLEN
ncbi:hypothetical protein [Rhizobium leguminosarum]|uniref:hypothetical protein n=1 Tax=Rhizobium leguminosarum TaxID=384 RepID=UPI0004830B23|nr:hypothetical protein [Rhizobium leguminosarum]WFT88408.1 hypothetical protein QA638_12740 [Rhizobium leguminosarum]